MNDCGTGQVLIGDANSLARTGLRALLREEFALADCAEVASFADLLFALKKGRASSLVVVDIALPGLGGSEGLRRLRMEHPASALVAIATSRDRSEVLEIVAAGVHGCIPKDLAIGQMRAAFAAVLSGQIYVPALVSEVNRARSPSFTPHAPFTGRQREVLEHLASGKSNKEIARTLQISESTVKVHVAAAYRLLGVHNRVSAVAALRAGSRFQEGNEPQLPGLFRERRRLGDAKRDIQVHCVVN